MQYTSVNTILAKFHRETQNEGISESYLISMIGEALEFLRVADNQEQAVAFIEVKDYHAILPQYFNSILQVAKDNSWVVIPEDVEDTSCSPQSFLEKFGECCTTEDIIPTPPITSDCLMTDCQGNIIGEAEKVYYRPYFDLKWEYQFWCTSRYYREKYTPIRLANHTFFNTIVAKEKEENIPYNGSTYDEYTIVGKTDRQLRFSFQEGRIALSYLRTVIDEETGYPCIPDNISHVTAITYYIKWKLAEGDFDNNRDGAVSKMQYYESKWLKYVKQAKNWAKMPKDIDTYQNLLEQSHYLIPRHRRYYGFFGNLGREEARPFNDPDYKNKRTITKYNGRR